MRNKILLTEQQKAQMAQAKQAQEEEEEQMKAQLAASKTTRVFNKY
jgi:hypothetical protein